MPSRIALDRWLLALAALVLASTAARFALSRGIAAPWIAPDEQLYGLLGRSLVAGDGLRVLGESVPYYSALYPLLLGVPLRSGSLASGITVVQAAQALLMSATAVPVYLWARPITGPRWALGAATLTVLIPGLAYSGLLMSEALYFPVATLAVWALAACLSRPTPARQGLLLAALALALATRLQAVGVVAAVVVAVGLVAAAERSTGTARRMLPTVSVLAVASLGWIALRVALGGFGELLGAYTPLVEARSYSPLGVLQAVAWQTAALVLLTVGIPLLALGVLAWETFRGRETEARVRALVIATLAYTAVTLVEVGAFASRFVDHVSERQLLSLAPPTFVVFVVWLQRRLPRPQPLTSLLAVAIVASAALLPRERLVTPAAAVDAVSTIPLELLSRRLDADLVQGVFAIAAAIVLGVAVVVPRRGAPALAVLVGAFFVAASPLVAMELRDRSTTDRARVFAGLPPSWIDETGARDVTLLLTGERSWPSVWHEIFWNSSIEQIARIAGVESPGVVPQEVVTLFDDGHLVTTRGHDLSSTYAAAPSGVSLRGERIVAAPAAGGEPGLVLWRTDGPLVLDQQVVGFRPGGDLHGGDVALVRVFGCDAGDLELTLIGKEGRPTRVFVNDVLLAERALASEEIWRPRFPTPRSADGTGLCVYRIETEGLVGSTRVEFVRRG